MTHFIKLNQAGDTIIEVLIAISITGLVLGGAYGAASRSLNLGRQAQERVEATKLAEGQIELLKSRAVTDSSKPTTDETSIFADIYSTDSNNTFCLYENGAEAGVTSVSKQNKPDSELTSDTFVFNISGAPGLGEIYSRQCVVGIDDRYKLFFTRTDLEDSGTKYSTFTLKVRWDRLGGGRDEVAMRYRLHRGQF